MAFAKVARSALPASLRAVPMLLLVALRGDGLLSGRSAVAFLGLAGPALSIFALPFLGAWLPTMLGLLLSFHRCLSAARPLPSLLPSSFLLGLVLRLSAFLTSPFVLLLICPPRLFLSLRGFAWHFVLSFHYLPLCSYERRVSTIGRKGYVNGIAALTGASE